VQCEQRGRPTVVFTTTKFEQLTRTVARNYGLPGLRIVTVPHPLGGTDEETILRWADTAVDDVIALFSGS
jgi:hypothetical protein